MKMSFQPIETEAGAAPSGTAAAAAQAPPAVPSAPSTSNAPEIVPSACSEAPASKPTTATPPPAPVSVPVPVPEAPEEAPAESTMTQAPAATFSWLEPHYQFVVLFVGPEQVPFGLQKDFLCAKSSHYRQYFAENDEVESVVKLPDTPVEVFAYAQNFLYTGSVFPSDGDPPTYEVLVGVWKLGLQLDIQGLCDQTLEAMVQVRQATQSIPAPPLLVQVWKDTPEGSSMRRLLLDWAAEYVRSSESNAEFAKSLPQEVLSELVLAMSRTDTTPLVQLGGNNDMANASAPPQPPRKVVHYVDQEEDEEHHVFVPATKKQRRLEPLPHGQATKPPAKKPRASQPATKAAPRRRSSAAINGNLDFTTEQKLHFCQDLLTRMLSGPGQYPPPLLLLLWSGY